MQRIVWLREGLRDQIVEAMAFFVVILGACMDVLFIDLE